MIIYKSLHECGDGILAEVRAYYQTAQLSVFEWS